MADGGTVLLTFDFDAEAVRQHPGARFARAAAVARACRAAKAGGAR